MDEQQAEAGVVRREVDLDLVPGELWELVGDGDRWAEWLAEAAEVEVAPGRGGRVVDDRGVARRVAVDEVDPGRLVRFAWWPEDEAGSASTVELVVLPHPRGSRLRVTEVLGAQASALAVGRARKVWVSATARVARRSVREVTLLAA